MNDSVSALYQVFYNFGGMVSPIIGAALYDLFGYGITMNICALFILIMAVVFLVFNAGKDVFKNFKEQKRILEELKTMKKEDDGIEAVKSEM